MLFEPQLTRWPDHYPWANDFIDAMQDGLWNAKKFSFDSDKADFELRLSRNERRILVRALSAIAQIEVQVKTFWKRVGEFLRHPSIIDLTILMAYIEVVHNAAYEKLLRILGLMEAIIENMNVPAVAGRVNYLNKHAERAFSDDRKQHVYSLILFTLFVENVSLFTQFYVVLWMNRDGRLKDTAQQVKYTRNEETLHAQAGMRIINTLRSEYPELFDEEMERKIKHECHVALGAECELINWMIGDFDEELRGERLNADILKGYVAQRLNESLQGIGYEPIFTVSDEIKKATFWMETGVYAPVKVDFFHGEPTEYAIGDTSNDDDF